MSYSITLTGPIGTVDITNKVMRASLSKSLGESSATFDVLCKDLLTNHTMESIAVMVDDVVRFNGIVKAQSTSKVEPRIFTSLKCVDATDKLQRRLVAEAFQNRTPKQMLTSIITAYAPWVTMANVEDIGGPVESMIFNYDTAAEAIQKLAEITGAYWYLDKDNGLHFFLENDGTAPIDYDATSNILRDSFTLDDTAFDLANRIWIIGSRAASSTFSDFYWSGDGLNDTVVLPWIPNYPEIKENGVTKTIEVDKGSTSDKDYVYSKKDKTLRRVAGPLPGGSTAYLRARPTVQVIDYFEDSASVATYGLYEKAIRDRKITDKAAARKRGRAALKKVKSLMRLPKWSTRDWAVDPGQLTNVSVPSFGFSARCRINSISVEFTPEDIVAQIDAQEV
jgi:hypothetical protein